MWTFGHLDQIITPEIIWKPEILLTQKCWNIFFKAELHGRCQSQNYTPGKRKNMMVSLEAVKMLATQVFWKLASNSPNETNSSTSRLLGECYEDQGIMIFDCLWPETTVRRLYWLDSEPHINTPSVRVAVHIQSHLTSASAYFRELEALYRSFEPQKWKLITTYPWDLSAQELKYWHTPRWDYPPLKAQ